MIGTVWFNVCQAKCRGNTIIGGEDSEARTRFRILHFPAIEWGTVGVVAFVHPADEQLDEVDADFFLGLALRARIETA